MNKCMDHTLTILVYHDILQNSCSLHYFCWHEKFQRVRHNHFPYLRPIEEKLGYATTNPYLGKSIALTGA